MAFDQALEQGMQPHSGSVPSERIADAARAAMGFYKRIRRHDEDIPEPFRVGGEWREYVAERSWLYDAMLAGDEETVIEGLRSFWRNGLGPIVSQYAYFSDLEAGDEAKAERFTTRLAEDYEHWRSLWREEPSVLEVPDVGDPWGLHLDGVLVTPLALRFYNHGRQIRELLRDMKTPIVGEIGGGYGGMAHRAVTLEPRLTYVDFDLPETLAIATFYLLATLPERDVLLWEEGMTLDRETLGGHDIVLAPHYAYAELAPDTLDLVLNAFSLSEMKPDAIAEYVGRLPEVCRGYFLQNNVDRAGVVNRGFERTPCSRFPLDPDAFKTIYFKFDTYQGASGDYRESLHQRIAT